MNFAILTSLICLHSECICVKKEVPISIDSSHLAGPEKFTI